MVQFNIFPGGKRRLVNFSFDDGDPNDKRITELLNKYNLKGTFFLNGKNCINLTSKDESRLHNMYLGHEIGCHGLNHKRLTYMTSQSIVSEIYEERKILEKVFGAPVLGFAYPCGSSNLLSKQIISDCGFKYARKAGSAGNALAEDFFLWNPTCNLSGAEEWSERFISDIDSEWAEPALSVRGHGHDLKSTADWIAFEGVLEKLSGNKDVWYATFIDIYHYLTAQKNLEYNVSEDYFYNPSAVDLWIEKENSIIINIPSGKSVNIKELL